MQILGAGERVPQRSPRPQGGRGPGLTCVVPPASARPLAVPSKAPETPVLSACGSVVRRKVAPGPRVPAPPPPVPPPPAHTRAPASFPSPPSARAPRPPPDPARYRSPCRANLELPLAPLGRNLGQLVLVEHPILGPGNRELPERLAPPGRGKEPTGFVVLLGARREPAAVPGARIAAWLEAESALGDRLQR